MSSIKDDRGYSQGFTLAKSTTVRMKRRTGMLLSEMNPTPDTRILEIGCGTGEVSYWMAEQSPARVLGTDLCVPFIEGAREKYRLPNLEYAVLDFNDPHALPDAQFDYIVGNGILHHLYHNLDAALANIRRLLKDGGKIVFLEPNLYNPYIFLIFSFPFLRKLSHLEPDEMAFSRRFIADRLHWAGFADIRVSYKDFLLPGIPSFLVAPSIVAGSVLERVPLINAVAQSIFLSATKPSDSLHAPQAKNKRRITRDNIFFLFRYGISGGIGALVQSGFLFLWVSVFGFERIYLWGAVLGFIIALAVAFSLQKYWTFRDRSSTTPTRQFVIYGLVATLNLFLITGGLELARTLFVARGVDFFNWWYLLVQAGIIVIVSAMSLALNSLFTFRKDSPRTGV